MIYIILYMALGGNEVARCLWQFVGGEESNATHVHFVMLIM